MADETAKLVVAVDSTQAQTAAKDLDNLTAAGGRAQSATDGLAQGAQRATSAGKDLNDTIRRQNEQMGLLRNGAQQSVIEIQKLRDAEERAAKSAETATTGTKKLSGSHSELSFTSGQAAREYAVLVNELQRGDFTRLQGSMITLANRVGLMPKLFTAMGAAVGGTLLVLGTFAAAMISGANAQLEFHRAMEATGGFAGKTESEIVSLTGAMQDAAHTYGETREALLAVAESGRFAQDRIALVAQGVLDMSRVTGASVEDMTKQFEKLQEDPVRAAMELDKSMHFLETSTLLAAQAAENLGDKEKAAEIVLTAAAAAAHKRATDMEQDVGYMIARWRELKNAVSDTWNWMQDLGKKATDLENVVSSTTEIRAAQAKLRDAQRGKFDARTGMFAPADVDLVHQYTVELNKAVAAGEHAQQTLLDNTQLAKSNAEQAKHTQLVNEAVVAINAETMALDRQARREAEVAAIRRKFALARSSDDPNVAKDAAYNLEAEAKAVANVERRYRDFKQTRVAMTQAEKDARKEANAHDQQLKTLDQTIAEHKAIVDQEATSTKDLSETHKWAQRQIELLTDSYSHLTPAEQEVRKAQIQAIVVQDDLNNARQQEAKVTEDATRALERYVKQGNARAIQEQRQIDAIGHSGDWASQKAREYQIIDEAENARIQLTDKARAAEQLETDAYKKGIQQIGVEMNKQLEQERKFYQERKEAMGDWRNGAQRAWEEFSLKASDVAGQTYDSFQTAFSGMESAIDTFAKTGKFKMQDFARTVLAELAKIELRILLSSILSNIFGAATSGGGAGATDSGGVALSGGGGGVGTGPYAKGGAFAGGVQVMAKGGLIDHPTLFPMANGRGLAGEAGIEGVVPLKRMADGKLGVHSSGGGGVTYNVSTNVTLASDGTSTTKTTADDSKQAKILGEFLTTRVKELLVQEQRQGGILWRMNQT